LSADRISGCREQRAREQIGVPGASAKIGHKAAALYGCAGARRLRR